MIKQSTAHKVLEAALHRGGDFAEIFIEDKHTLQLGMYSGVLENAQSGNEFGAGLRVLVYDKCIYVQTNEISEEKLLELARKAAAAVDEIKKTPFFNFDEKNYKSSALLLPDSIQYKQKIELMKTAHRAAADSSGELSQIVVNYAETVQNVLIANTEGIFSSDERVRTRFSVQCVAGDTEKQTGYEAPGHAMGFEVFEKRIDVEQVARNAAQVAVKMLHAPKCPSGVYPAVIDGGFGGVIFHEACGHSLESSMVSKNDSVFSGKLGQKIAADCVSAVDDGSMPGEWGSCNIDDEGMPTRKNVLIENGVLKSYMVDIIGARRMNCERTGSGRRQGYGFAPCSRMTNTYIAPGSDDEEEMIASMGEGLYAKRMGGGSVNPLTGEFNFAVMEGYWVKDGKIAHPVRGGTLIGKGQDTLLGIDRVGKNMWMAAGMCGSYSGSVPTNVGQPRIRVKAMTIGGGQ